jgi:hypothetical protein
MTEEDKNWSAVMKLAERHGFISFAYGGVALLATKKNQMKHIPKPIMKTEEEIRAQIEEIKKNNHHVLYVGSPATIQINAPRALMQMSAEIKLSALYWVLGEEFKHKYPKAIPNS